MKPQLQKKNIFQVFSIACNYYYLPNSRVDNKQILKLTHFCINLEVVNFQSRNLCNFWLGFWENI